MTVDRPFTSPDFGDVDDITTVPRGTNVVAEVPLRTAGADRAAADTGRAAFQPSPIDNIDVGAAAPRVTFTVSSALRWLGHECPGTPCHGSLAQVPASIWFPLTILGGSDRARCVRVVITRDVPRAFLGHLHAAIVDVNCCTRGEDVEVWYQFPSAHRVGAGDHPGVVKPAPSPPEDIRSASRRARLCAVRQMSGSVQGPLSRSTTPVAERDTDFAVMAW